MGILCSKKSVEDEEKETQQRNEDVPVVFKIQKYLKREKNIPLNIVVTGEAGSGKSSFVNAIRGVDDDDEEAAPTGAVETTMEVTPYPHPNFPNVVLWELPNMSTLNFPAAKYLKKVGLEEFDSFIIISAGRFRENDVKLAKEIQKMKKKLYFVHSKIDQDVSNEKSKKHFNEERILGKIRESYIRSLQEQGLVSPQVFLVSSHEPLNYDFPDLLSTLERELPEHKRDAFLLAMPNTSLEMIDRKKEAFQSKIKYVATLSAAVEAEPVPGLSVAVDLNLLVGVVTRYVFGFGLDTSSLERMSNYTGVPYEELKKIMKSPLAAAKITPDHLLKTLTQNSSQPQSMAEEEFISVCQTQVPVGPPFTFTSEALNGFLKVLAEDAKRVFQNCSDLNSTLSNKTTL